MKHPSYHVLLYVGVLQPLSRNDIRPPTIQTESGASIESRCAKELPSLKIQWSHDCHVMLLVHKMSESEECSKGASSSHFYHNPAISTEYSVAVEKCPICRKGDHCMNCAECVLQKKFGFKQQQFSLPTTTTNSTSPQKKRQEAAVAIVVASAVNQQQSEHTRSLSYQAYEGLNYEEHGCQQTQQSQQQQCRLYR